MPFILRSLYGLFASHFSFSIFLDKKKIHPIELGIIHFNGCRKRFNFILKHGFQSLLFFFHLSLSRSLTVYFPQNIINVQSRPCCSSKLPLLLLLLRLSSPMSVPERGREISDLFCFFSVQQILFRFTCAWLLCAALFSVPTHTHSLSRSPIHSLYGGYGAFQSIFSLYLSLSLSPCVFLLVLAHNGFDHI